MISVVQKYNDHWYERSEHAASARLYLNSDVCKKSELRVQLGKWQQCAESRYELRISPSVRALYDVLEDFSICGHKRCEALASWIQTYKYFILLFGLFSLYCFYEFYKWNTQMHMVNRFMGGTLPGGAMVVN
jgi:hypothetical protein